MQAAVLFAEPLIELIPLGVLVGLIFSVVLETFDVRTFEYFFVLPVADRYLRAGLGMFCYSTFKCLFSEGREVHVMRPVHTT